MKLNIANLLQIEHNCRNAQSYEELRYIIVNETRKLIPYKTALFFFANKNKDLKVEAISDVATVNTNSIFVQTLQSIANKALKKSDSLHLINNEEELDSYEREVLEEYKYKNLLFVPIKIEKNDASISFYMILINEEPFEKKHLEVCSHLSGSYAYFLYAMTKNSFSLKLRKRSFFKGYFKYLFLVFILLMFIPIKMSVLAPLEVVPKEPFIVTSALDAAVKEINVKPNDEVKIGELLVTLDNTSYKNDYELAKKSLDIAKAQLHTSSQASFFDINQKRKIAELKTQVELKEVELKYRKEQLEKTKIYAKKDGIAIVHNPNEWKGKPVIIGEKILYIANKNMVELKIMLPVSDAIFIEKNANIKAFFDNDPLNSWQGKVEHISYKPQLSTQNILSYKIIASFDSLDKNSLPSIGLRGTAKIYSEEVTLFFYLFKKPITSLRQYIGW
ncbi:efflux RND transporter periplasmic adaptor subunit [Arcobacter sp. YIC-464]|uniref:efflux RND transporter periplasmic adaptor subunit n=1 Tax=Arcobacter sp. YIC-464 TaxID=3376631 RepID=UPI003C179E04